MKCFVANGYAASLRKDQGDAAKAALYEANAKRAFDGAVNLGHRIGLSNREMNHDLDVAHDVELPKMVRNSDYFISAVGDCKALGLM